MALQLGLGPWGSTIAELTRAAIGAEAGGFESIWIPELHRSPFVPLTTMAVHTSEIAVGTGIALAFVRSPLTIALSALDLDEVAGGRFRLGLGSGVKRLNTDWHNVRFGSPVAHMRETIHIVRRLWAELPTGDPIEHEGEWERVRLRGYRRPFHQQRSRIPIYLAAVGPVMTQLAGEVGDGWIAHELGSPQYLREVVMPNLEVGLRRAGRNRGNLAVVASAACLPNPDSRWAKRRMAGVIAFYASVRTYTGFFAWHGFGAEARAIQNLFRAGDVPGMLRAVTDEMVTTLSLAGTADEVREGLARYDGVADIVKLTPPTSYVDDEVTRSAQDAILEIFSV